jgi:hypothetical protein
MQQCRGDALWYPLQFVLFGQDVELNGMGLAVRCVMHSSPTLALVYALAHDARLVGRTFHFATIVALLALIAWNWANSLFSGFSSRNNFSKDRAQA